MTRTTADGYGIIESPRHEREIMARAQEAAGQQSEGLFLGGVQAGAGGDELDGLLPGDRAVFDAAG